MNNDLKQALLDIEREKNISLDVMVDAIENSLIAACRNSFKSDNIFAAIDRETFEFRCWAEKVVTEDSEITDPKKQISLADAVKIAPDVEIGSTVQVPVDSKKELSRIATLNAKNVIFQKIREEERISVFNQYSEKEHQVVSCTVQRYVGHNVAVNLGKTEALLMEKEMIRNESYVNGMRMKVYVLEVRNSNRTSKILVSRTHPELVKKLFEEEVAEIQDGTVEIRSIAREPGSRTKIAVWSNNPDVDPVGACVGMNGARVNAIVEELGEEKIDVVSWDPNPGNFIQNALSPAKIVVVFADPDDLSAKVVVPDYQLSLAIGREGQNARLAAKLTGYKIDIKSETQAKDTPGFRYEDYEEVMGEEEYEDYESGLGYEGEEAQDGPSDYPEDAGYEEETVNEETDGADAGEEGD
ncbi:MAG: transcription termination/antitermination protein NusA [Lachnospiraceae bacterium]|nr:transcription termination/antitermination protein NusA [Lachnospiraceae bacterium]